MFDGLVTARPQLKVGCLDDVLHGLEKPKVTGSEGWLVRRVLKHCDLLLGQELLYTDGIISLWILHHVGRTTSPVTF